MDRSDFHPSSANALQHVADPVDGAPFYRLNTDFGYTQSRHYQVIPISHGFFHVREAHTGQIRGFRCSHYEACALASQLEKIQPDFSPPAPL